MSRFCHREVLPFAAMVAAESANVGTNILFKLASSKGLSFYVFIAYFYAIANPVMLPFLFIFRSSTPSPSFKFPLISRICLLGFIGFFAQVLAYKGIDYSSASLAAVINNLSPAFTFILAIIYRMEKIVFRSSSSRAKIIGTIVSIAGSLVVVFYEGPTVFSSTSSGSFHPPLSSLPLSNWLIGFSLLVAARVLFSFWSIIVTEVMEIYPAEFIVIFLSSLCGSIMYLPVCLIAEPKPSSWILKSSVAIVAVVYTGVIGKLMVVVQAWGLRIKGPVYVAIFKPLSIVIAAVMSSLFLGEALTLGSVIGSVIISVGFYAVIWGKAREEAVVGDDQRPLLQSRKVDDNVIAC